LRSVTRGAKARVLGAFSGYITKALVSADLSRFFGTEIVLICRVSEQSIDQNLSLMTDFYQFTRILKAVMVLARDTLNGIAQRGANLRQRHLSLTEASDQLLKVKDRGERVYLTIY
jgi:hypothetical protein